MLHTPSILTAQPLTATAFAAFGQVVAVPSTGPGAVPRGINGGNAWRYDVVPDLQLHAAGGCATLAVFRAAARDFPLAVVEMERHALGSQTFIPLGTHRFVVVVAAAASACGAHDLQAFITDGQQGVVLAPGTWHHALLAVEGGDFAVLERKGAHTDCALCQLAVPVQLQLAL